MRTKTGKRKASNAKVYFITAALTISALLAMAFSVFHTVTAIEVNGSLLISEEDVIYVSGIDLGSNLFLVMTYEAQNRIREAMPLIYSANVQRVLPNRIVIEITESRAIAYIAYEDEIILLDASGRVIELTNGSAPYRLIEVRGISVEEAIPGKVVIPQPGGEIRVRVMIDILTAMRNTGVYKTVTYLDVTNVARAFFDYYAVTVELGATEDAEVKLSELDAMFEKINICPQNSRGRLSQRGWVPE